MPTKIGVGESKKVDSFEAGKEATKLALEKGKISKPNFCLIFSTVGYDLKDLLYGIREVVNDTPLIGCSGEGIITQNGSNEEIYGVGVMAFESDEISFHCARGEKLKENSKEAGIKIGKTLSPFLKEKRLLFCFFQTALL